MSALVVIRLPSLKACKVSYLNKRLQPDAAEQHRAKAGEVHATVCMCNLSSQPVFLAPIMLVWPSKWLKRPSVELLSYEIISSSIWSVVQRL